MNPKLKKVIVIILLLATIAMYIGTFIFSLPM